MERLRRGSLSRAGLKTEMSKRHEVAESTANKAIVGLAVLAEAAGDEPLLEVLGKPQYRKHQPEAKPFDLTKTKKSILEQMRLFTGGTGGIDRWLTPNTHPYSVGEPLKSFRTAWVTAVLKAHDIKPRWRKKGGYRDLTQECLDAFQTINLHWHDLRHEYASRLVERGVPLAQVRDLLGHASIATTERYDNQKLEALQAASRRLEDGKGFDATPPSDASKFQESFKIDPRADSQPVDESDAKMLKDLGLRNGSGTGNRTPVPWLRTTYPNP